MANKTSSNGIGFGTVLFLVFLVLKLTGNIDWSWWWVTSPLWIPLTLGVVIISIIGIVMILLNKK
jgi:hypothetical protein